MAIEVDATWRMNVSLKDRDNNTSTMTFYYPGAESAANVQGFLTGTLVPAIAGITNAVITGWSYSFSGTETDPLLLVAPEESDVERKASFVFKDSGGGFMKLELPSPKNTLVVDGTQALDPANPVVAAFIDAIVDTGALDLTNAVNFRNLGLIARIGPVRKIHRKSGKG